MSDSLPSAGQPAPASDRYDALDLIAAPVWVFDIDHRCVHWANTAALRVWDAAALQDLCARLGPRHVDLVGAPAGAVPTGFHRARRLVQ